MHAGNRCSRAQRNDPHPTDAGVAQRDLLPPRVDSSTHFALSNHGARLVSLAEPQPSRSTSPGWASCRGGCCVTLEEKRNTLQVDTDVV